MIGEGPKIWLGRPGHIILVAWQMSTEGAAEIARLVARVEDLRQQRAELMTKQRRARGTVNFEELLSACVDLGARAGSVIRSVWQSGDLGVVDKGGGISIEVQKAADL